MKRLNARRSSSLGLFAVALAAGLLVGSGPSRSHAEQPRVLAGRGGGILGIHLVAFSPDSKTLASASVIGERNIWLWDVQTGKTRIELRPFDAMPWAEDMFEEQWANQKRGPLTHMLKRPDVQHLFFSDDGKTLVVFCSHPYHAILLYETATGNVRQCIRVDEEDSEKALSGWTRRTGKGRMVQGRPVGMGGPNGMRRGGRLGGGMIGGMGGGGGYCRYADLSPDGKYVAAGGAMFEMDLVKVWDTEGRLLFTLSGHNGKETGGFVGNAGVAGVAFVNLADNASPPSERTTSGRNTLTSGGVLRSTVVHSPWQSTPHGNIALASVDFMDNIRLWNLQGRKIGEWNLRDYFPREHPQRPVAPYRSMTISPDRKTLAIGGLPGIGRICLWDANQREVTRVFRESERLLGYTLSALLTDGTKPIWTDSRGASVWDLEVDERIAAIMKKDRNALFATLSPDNKTLAVAGGLDQSTGMPITTIRLWDLTAEDE